MYKVYLLPLFILVLASSPLLAQKPTQPYRLELELDSYKTEVELIAPPDSSLLLFTKTEGGWGTPPTFEFTRYNLQLASDWTKKVELNRSSRYLTHFSEEPYTYVAFSGEYPDEFQFVKLNHKTGIYTKQAYTIESIDSIYVLKVVDNNYFLIARSRTESTPLLLHLNPQTGAVLPLPAAYGSESTFSDVLAHPEQEQLSVVMAESNGRISRLQTKLFAANGKLLGNYFTHPYQDKRPLVAEITPGDTTNRLLIGSYANRHLRYATGFFTSPVIATPDAIRFYSFLQLKNFFKYMKPKREERTRRRESNRLAAGKEPGLQYRLLLNDIYPTRNGFVLVAEVYTTSSGESAFNRLYDPKGYLLRSPKTYRRVQAVVLGFDKNGVLLWDNSFPLENLETLELRPSVEVAANLAGTVVVAYPDKGDIKYKIMDQDVYVKDKTALELQSKAPEGKVLSTSMAGIISWYGLNFAAFGWHRVKDSSAESRSVFYINKVSF